MTYSISLVAITPLPMKDLVETLGVMLGHHGNEFTVPLTSDGITETHKALHAWVTPEYSKYWTGEAYPAIEGFTHQQIDAVRSQLIISLQEGVEPLAHFHEVLQTHSLQGMPNADNP